MLYLAHKNCRRIKKEIITGSLKNDTHIPIRTKIKWSEIFRFELRNLREYWKPIRVWGNVNCLCSTLIKSIAKIKIKELKGQSDILWLDRRKECSLTLRVINPGLGMEEESVAGGSSPLHHPKKLLWWYFHSFPED